MAEAAHNLQGSRTAQSGAAPSSIKIHDTESRMNNIAPTACVSTLAVIGASGEWRDRESRWPAVLNAGCIVREFVRVHAGCAGCTVIGERTLLMSGSHIGHDTVVGADCEIAPNAVVGGCVTLGDRVRVGMNATINPHVSVGDDARIGSGAVVNKDIPAGETWVGIPARRIR